MEQILEESLFVRAGRGIVPTLFAEELIDDVKEALEKLDSISARRPFLPSEIDAEFSIATTDIERSVLLLDSLREMRRQAPNLRLRFLWESYNDIRALRRMDVDFIVSPIISSSDSDIRTRLLFRDHAVCYYDPEYRDAPDTMEKYLGASHVRVMFSENDVSLTDVALTKLGLTRQIAFTMPSVSELPKLIIGSDLTVTMPSRISRTIFKDLANCVPPFAMEEMRFNLFWHERTQNSARHQWFRQTLFDIASRRNDLRQD